MRDNSLFAEGVTDTAQQGDEKLDMDKFATADDNFLSNLEDGAEPGQDVNGDINDSGGEPNEYDDDIDSSEYDFNMDEDVQNDMLDIDIDEDEGMFSGNDGEDEADETDEKEIDQEDSEQLAQMNKALDTDYKSLKELKDALNGTKTNEDGAPEVEKLPKEKIQAYEKNKNTIDYFQKEKNRPVKEIVNDYFINQEKKRLGVENLDQDQLDQIEDKVSIMETSGSLDLYGENVKNKMDNVIANLSAQNKSIESEQKQIQTKRDNILKSSLQDTITEYYKKDFYGIKLDKERTKKAYDSILSNDLFKKVENSPKLMAEVALFLEYRNTLSQKTNGPSYSDGVKNVMDEISGNNSDPMTAQVRNRTIAKTNKSTDLKSRWLS